MSSTTSTTPSPTSTSRVIQVEIPASTVLAIGLGFVGLVFGLLALSLSVRMYRVRRRLAAVRATGQNMDFGTAWQREGGMFGFFTSMGSNALAVGAGASVAQRGQEILWGWTQVEKARPVIWDVPIREKEDETGSADDLCEPFALSSTISPRYVDRATPVTDLRQPRFTLSILISLPREAPVDASSPKPEAGHTPDEEEDWPELPEILIGTTQVCPMIYESVEATAHPETRGLVARKGEEERMENSAEIAAGDGTESVVLAPRVGRPARWERYDVVKWRIEGMR